MIWYDSEIYKRAWNEKKICKKSWISCYDFNQSWAKLISTVSLYEKYICSVLQVVFKLIQTILTRASGQLQYTINIPVRISCLFNFILIFLILSACFFVLKTKQWQICKNAQSIHFMKLKWYWYLTINEAWIVRYQYHFSNYIYNV